MSLVLRHEPERIGLFVDEEGWANLEEFAARIGGELPGTELDDILEVARTDAKGRYVIESGRIRAAQGHSIDVDTVGEAQSPPSVLYHGTTADAWQAIRHHGAIHGMGRIHVHLSSDVVTALSVAKRRRGHHVVLEVDSARMHADSVEFYRAANGVWLTRTVALRYVRQKNDW